MGGGGMIAQEVVDGAIGGFQGVVSGISDIVNTELNRQNLEFKKEEFKEMIRQFGLTHALQQYATKHRITMEEAQQRYNMVMGSADAKMSTALASRTNRMQSQLAASNLTSNAMQIKAARKKQQTQERASEAYLRGIAGAFSSGTESAIARG
jgi:hypothetical protein